MKRISSNEPMRMDHRLKEKYNRKHIEKIQVKLDSCKDDDNEVDFQ